MYTRLNPMTIAPGTRLGPYEITAPLGAGGMGEISRGRDTRMGHDVAHEDGTHFLVMELIQGESRTDHLEKGALPIAQVLRYGAADALDRAHECGGNAG
jgi:eukaryotic-like serine/threonine-protein kinase